jgi:hypothetical protein
MAPVIAQMSPASQGEGQLHKHPLNPSIADEQQLDPTLRCTRAFSAAWGYNGFIMTNLFGLVSTDPAGLYAVADPIGPENDRHCRSWYSRTLWTAAAFPKNQRIVVFRLIQ